jgi:hypothetical protein
VNEMSCRRADLCGRAADKGLNDSIQVPTEDVLCGGEATVARSVGWDGICPLREYAIELVPDACDRAVDFPVPGQRSRASACKCELNE